MDSRAAMLSREQRVLLIPTTLRTINRQTSLTVEGVSRLSGTLGTNVEGVILSPWLDKDY